MYSATQYPTLPSHGIADPIYFLPAFAAIAASVKLFGPLFELNCRVHSGVRHVGLHDDPPLVQVQATSSMH